MVDPKRKPQNLKHFSTINQNFWHELMVELHNFVKLGPSMFQPLYDSYPTIDSQKAHQVRVLSISNLDVSFQVDSVS